ncbi:hypothetical protein GALL_549120 [mine drainage metagenome]|uniref:Uncharacterized protein n=1 Tax=mine drainage metagenome TaxID=410659 RepID=A0A1J5PE83_9ZZZZ
MADIASARTDRRLDRRLRQGAQFGEWQRKLGRAIASRTGRDRNRLPSLLLIAPGTANVIGKISEFDAALRFSQSKQCLRDRHKLAPVAGPRIRQKSLSRLWTEPDVPRRQHGLQQFADARLTVILVAQCRQGNREMLQPVVQVRSETALGGHRLEVSMGCAHQGKIDGLLTPSPQGLDLVVLQDAQEPRLQRQGHVADFIEKQNTAVRFTDETGLPLAARPRKRPLLVPEQFGLDQAFGHGGAIDRDEGTPMTLAAFVNLPGKDLFADSGLSENQDGDAGVHDADRAVQLRIAPGIANDGWP